MSLVFRSVARAIAELESSIRTCHRCRQPFCNDELYVVLEGTCWHQNCFRCAQCLLLLSLNENFFEVDGRFYCEHDFQVLYAPICTKCNSFVVGKVMKSANFSFHPECFLCENCEGPLEDGVWCVNGRMVCYTCKEQSPKIPHYVCLKCRQLIQPEDLLRTGNDYYHAYHFNCNDCKTALTGEARELDKQWYCQRCFDRRCETCTGCHKPIDRHHEKSVMALGKSFHVEHFCCSKCDVAFVGRQHYELNGKAYCEDDFVKLCGEFCHLCDKLLSHKSSVNLLGRKWCVDCYRCLACDRVLKHSDKVFNLDMRPLCKKCFRRKDFKKYLSNQPNL
ncbi:hypothetical protein Q1695_007841 [Nippostrongylus brasiliensis]|nr:hypothetical protein Q1695_007841 [Nippostrongylus brasiliensis]